VCGIEERQGVCQASGAPRQVADSRSAGMHGPTGARAGSSNARSANSVWHWQVGMTAKLAFPLVIKLADGSRRGHAHIVDNKFRRIAVGGREVQPKVTMFGDPMQPKAREQRGHSQRKMMKLTPKTMRRSEETRCSEHGRQGARQGADRGRDSNRG